MKKSRALFVVLLLFLLFLIGLLVCRFLFFKGNTSSLEEGIISEEEKEQVKEDIVNDINTNDVSHYNKEENDNNSNSNNNSNTSNNTSSNNSDKKYDQYFVANGFSGASDNVYYTKSGVLYHLVLSTNEVIKVAKGVSKIENDVGTIMVYKGNGFEIFEEDNYLTYVD